MTLLAISGSLRAASSNSVLLRAVKAVAPQEVAVELYDGMGQLPHFSPDEEGGEVVAHLKRTVTQADGILFCTPEYVHGMPGSFKNLLDWLVSDGALWDKPVAVLSARKSEFAEPQLREVLRTLMAKVCEEASVVVPFPTNKMSVGEVLQNPELSGVLRQAVEAFVLFVQQEKRDVALS